MRIISISSMPKSNKIHGGRRSTVPSSCASVSCWFWIVTLHPSRGVSAVAPSYYSEFQFPAVIERLKDPDRNSHSYLVSTCSFLRVNERPCFGSEKLGVDPIYPLSGLGLAAGNRGFGVASKSPLQWKSVPLLTAVDVQLQQQKTLQRWQKLSDRKTPKNHW